MRNENLDKEITITKKQFTDACADALAEFVFSNVEKARARGDDEHGIENAIENIGLLGALVIRICRDKLFDEEVDNGDN